MEHYYYAIHSTGARMHAHRQHTMSTDYWVIDAVNGNNERRALPTTPTHTHTHADTHTHIHAYTHTHCL